MLGNLTEKLQGLVSKLRAAKKLTEENISEAANEVRLALLEADVNYTVAKALVKKIKEKAVGEEVTKSVTPGQQFVKVVHDELIALMGGEEAPLQLEGPLPIIMMCGLQGSGKTTHTVKIAHYLKKIGKIKNPLVAACDLQRPAAIEQLKTLAKQENITTFALSNTQNPLEVAKQAKAYAKEHDHDLLILDTAGRLHIDDLLMQELEQIQAALQPQEILFVANATTGQDAVNVANEFNKRLAITGAILTMLDGNTRGGAAISIREITGKPLKFEGIGEKINDLQPFNPTSMADRILGMGDTINLVRQAKEHFDEEEAEKLEKKIKTATFSYQDYLNQIQMVKKMGSFKKMFAMLPGIGSNLGALNIDDQEFYKVEAIIHSMTKKERSGYDELSIPRRKRIARGSGRDINDVNKLIKSFKHARKFFKNMPNLKKLEKMMTGGIPWR